MNKLIIKGGRVIDPLDKIDEKLDILIENGIIQKIGKDINDNYDELIDASGLIVSPGFVDMHVHLRDPGQTHKEDIESGARAAVKGGYTTIACMPNTFPVNDNIETSQYIIDKAKDIDIVNILPIASVTKELKGEELSPIEDLVKAGVIGFSDDGSTIVNPFFLKEALQITKEKNIIIIEHPEEHKLTVEGQINEGKISKKLNLKGIIDIAEDIIVSRDLIINEKIGGRLHLTHLSTKGSYRLIREAKTRGIGITSDVTPHHLLLNEDKLLTLNTNYKVKPPLRTEEDRLTMIEGIKDGTIDCIATDHAPHSLEEKNKEFTLAPFGMIGVETAFSVLHENLVKKQIIGIDRLIELIASNPAKILNLKNKGEIKRGYVADLTIIDPNKEFEFSKESFVSRSSNSPFLNWKGKGVPVYTIINGIIKYSSKGI